MSLATLIALSIAFSSSGCINLGPATTTQSLPVVNNTTTPTYTPTFSSGSPFDVILDIGQTTFNVPVGTIVTLNFRMQNSLPIDIPAGDIYFAINNIFCPCLVNETVNLNKLMTYNGVSITNLLYTAENISKAMYLESTPQEPYIKSGFIVKLDTGFLPTTKVSIPIMAYAPLGAIFEYNVCTAVNDYDYTNVPRNCNPGTSELSFATPSYVKPDVQVKTEYGDYKIIISFSKDSNVGQLLSNSAAVDGIVYKVFFNQKDITACCKPEYGLSKTLTWGNTNYTLDYSDPYISNSGPFKEKIVCELTPDKTNNVLTCNGEPIPGTDIVNGNMGVLDIAVGYLFEKNVGSVSFNLILGNNQLKNCNTNCDQTNKTIGTLANLPVKRLLVFYGLEVWNEPIYVIYTPASSSGHTVTIHCNESFIYFDSANIPHIVFTNESNSQCTLTIDASTGTTLSSSSSSTYIDLTSNLFTSTQPNDYLNITYNNTTNTITLNSSTGVGVLYTLPKGMLASIVAWKGLS